MRSSNGVRSLIVAPLCAVVGITAVAQEDTQRSSASIEAYEKFEAMRSYMQARNESDYAIEGPNAIDEARYVRIGGIDQWITIRGEDKDNPVLLFLHGGPGDATNPWSYAIFRSWLEQFTLVQWDQRGTGKTLGRNGPSIGSTITIDRLVEDGIGLAEFLRTFLNAKRVILLGHSFGSLIALFMVKERPDLFYAYVGTGQVADPSRNYRVAFDQLLREAQTVGLRPAISELETIGPPPYVDGRGYAVQRKWANRFEGADLFIASMLGMGLGAPGYSISDLNDWFQGQIISAQRLVPEAAELDIDVLGGSFEIPMFVIQGDEDFTTPTTLAEHFVEDIEAPQKEFVTLRGGHFAVFTAADRFLDELVARVRPLALP